MAAVPIRSPRRDRLAEVNHEPGERAIYRTVAFLDTIMRPFTRRDWRGQDKVPQTGGVIFVCNHISNVDPLVIGQFLAYSGRWPRFMGKASLFRVPLVGRVLTACGQIPVERNSRAAVDSLAAAITAIGDGKAVVIYPEGTITGDPHLWPMRGKTGAARVCLRTGCQVVPIGQWGAQEILYGKHLGVPRLLPPKTLHLLAGDPVDLDDLRHIPTTATVLQQATDRIMDAITALVAELRDETPPASRFDPKADATPEAAP